MKRQYEAAAAMLELVLSKRRTGELFATCLRAIGLTRREAAVLFGVAESNIYRWTRGLGPCDPRVWQLAGALLLDAYGSGVDWHPKRKRNEPEVIELEVD